MSKRLGDFEFRLRDRSFAPIIIGGMGVDISTAELALGAARLGGIGHISDAMSPYVSDKRFGTHFQNDKKQFCITARAADPTAISKWPPEMVYEASKRHVCATMSENHGPGGIFINVMEKLTMGDPVETLRARLAGALDGGIDGITLSAGLHNTSLRLIEDHPRFRDVYIGIIVSSLRALKIFLRGAQRLDRKPDYVVVEGPLAGGHLGFGEDWSDYDLASIIKEIVAFLKEEGLDIPVVAAGGVFTGSDAVDYIGFGASAVQVATRFTITKECGLPYRAKQKYLQSSQEDVTVNLTSPTGYYMRMLSTSPSLQANTKPNCDMLGYLLDKQGHCPYQEAYRIAPVDTCGAKLSLSEKMCICYHFMHHQCYTCGHYVYRLKETTRMLDSGEYYLPPMEHVFMDYLNNTDNKIQLPDIPVPDAST